MLSRAFLVGVRTMGVRGQVWFYSPGFNKTTRDRYAFDHPALMPEGLARDLILSYSRPGDLVLDPFSGAGTTAKMAILTGRHYLGYEAPKDDELRQKLRVQIRYLVSDIWILVFDVDGFRNA